jgi:hypothetical protein
MKAAIREAYRAGTLTVEAVAPATGHVFRTPVSAVLRHHTPHKPLIKVCLDDGREVSCTPDHSLFSGSVAGAIQPLAAGALKPGMCITVVQGESVREAAAVSCIVQDPAEFTFDLSVPGPENFVLSNGILAHNSYSIGGVSLDIDKSSKYESLKTNSEGQFDKATEAKQRTTKFLRGLQQPRFGIGVRSAFGSSVGKGVLSPRSFLSVLLCFMPLLGSMA